MRIEISESTSQKIAMILAEQHLDADRVSESVSRLIRRVADDEVLLRSLLLGESLSESDLTESLREMDQGIANAEAGQTRPAKHALGEIASELGIQIDR